MTDEKTKKVRIYLGRMMEGKKLQHFFRDIGDGKDYHYPKARAASFTGARIGRTYDLTDGLPGLWRDAEVEHEVSEGDVVKWQARDKVEAMKYQQRSIKPDSELQYFVFGLKQARASLPPMKRAAFDAWLLGAIR